MLLALVVVRVLQEQTHMIPRRERRMFLSFPGLPKRGATLRNPITETRVGWILKDG